MPEQLGWLSYMASPIMATSKTFGIYPRHGFLFQISSKNGEYGVCVPNSWFRFHLRMSVEGSGWSRIIFSSLVGNWFLRVPISSRARILWSQGSEEGVSKKTWKYLSLEILENRVVGYFSRWSDILKQGIELG